MLEDDETCAREWNKLAIETGWTSLVAGSVERALELAKENRRAIRFAMIDLMVPLYDEELDRLRALQEQRRQLTNNIIKAHKTTRQNIRRVQELDAEHISIDSTLRDLIVEDGGLLFLEEAAGRGWLNDWKYVVFSATDQVRREPELQNRGILKHGRYLGWYGKPIDPDSIVDLLKSHRG
jgi:hypothetical protein